MWDNWLDNTGLPAWHPLIPTANQVRLREKERELSRGRERERERGKEKERRTRINAPFANDPGASLGTAPWLRLPVEDLSISSWDAEKSSTWQWTPPSGSRCILVAFRDSRLRVTRHLCGRSRPERLTKACLIRIFVRVITHLDKMRWNQM